MTDPEFPLVEPDDLCECEHAWSEHGPDRSNPKRRPRACQRPNCMECGQDEYGCPCNWEPTAGDVIHINGTQIVNTPEDTDLGKLNARMMSWHATYGMIELSFALHPTGAELDE